MVPHETVWGMRPAGFHAFWGVPIGVYRMTGDEHFLFSLKNYLLELYYNYICLRTSLNWGFTKYNFLKGNEDYKFIWTNSVENTFTITLTM
jgi:hypothetical protein